jgi:16S rRNA (uracil1498-N3)-methyltransferase
MADRYYCPGLPSTGSVALEGDEARHLARVARKTVGDLVVLFDGCGRSAQSQVISIEKHHVNLEIRECKIDRPRWLDLTLFVAPPKGDRFDWIVEKATELGVSRLVPLRSERAVVDPRGSKLDRLRRTVIEACKQSGRNELMDIAEVASLDRAVQSPEFRFRGLADSGGLAPRQWTVPPSPSKAAVLIGPEGGWTEAERQTAAANGWTSLGLGPTRLRVETAAIAAVALILNLMPDHE